MAEPQVGGIPEHEHYEALCALAAGGLLDRVDFVDFHAHMKECSQCRTDYQELSALVTRELPQARGPVQQKLAEMRMKPLPYSRQRFLRRARGEGISFSSDVDTSERDNRSYFRPVAMLLPVSALVVVVITLALSHFRHLPEATPANATTKHIADLERENAMLSATLSRLTGSISADQRQINNLRAQAASERLRHSKGPERGQTGQSFQRTVDVVDEARNQDKLSAEAKGEAAHSTPVRFNDRAIVEQQIRIADLTNKLRIVSATLDQERQLVAAGNDVRELMASRKLHVIDVHDSDANGNPGPAFGRVFLTENKSLTFYAFDLDGGANVKRNFEVWAVPEAGKNLPRSLGFLHTDPKAQGRWVLKVENPELVKQISSVFVTVEAATGAKQPGGQKMLYAYLGDANHR